MRVLSFGLYLAAAASLASASRCKPSPSSSSSASASASAPASSSSAATAPQQPTFHLVASNPNLPVNGFEVEGNGDNSLLSANDESTDTSSTFYGYAVQAFHLEPGTGYLMVGDLYVAYSDYWIGLYLQTADQISTASDPLNQVACSIPLNGVPLSCVVVGSPTMTRFIAPAISNDVYFNMASTMALLGGGWGDVQFVVQMLP